MSHVKVMFRVRPGARAEDDYIVVAPPGDVMIHKAGSDDMYAFEYTGAAQNASNAVMYEQVGQPVVESVLDGCNGTVLAYGQTGAGADRSCPKLHVPQSMQCPLNTPREVLLLPCCHRSICSSERDDLCAVGLRREAAPLMLTREAGPLRKGCRAPSTPPDAHAVVHAHPARATV